MDDGTTKDGSRPGSSGASTRIVTFGHGTLSQEQFTRIVRRAGIDRIVDIRSYPGSRRNPQFGRETMERWLPEAGIGYSWLPDLGGRRRPRRDSRHTALRHEAFRAYADHMETDEFRRGISDLMELAVREQCAIMCSESVWWRCHRRLVADHLVLVEGVEVLDLMHDGRRDPHVVTPGVREREGVLIYDQDPGSASSVR